MSLYQSKTIRFYQSIVSADGIVQDSMPFMKRHEDIVIAQLHNHVF